MRSEGEELGRERERMKRTHDGQEVSFQSERESDLSGLVQIGLEDGGVEDEEGLEDLKLVRVGDGLSDFGVLWEGEGEQGQHAKLRVSSSSEMLLTRSSVVRGCSVLSRW